MSSDIPRPSPPPPTPTSPPHSPVASCAFLQPTLTCSSFPTTPPPPQPTHRPSILSSVVNVPSSMESAVSVPENPEHKEILPLESSPNLQQPLSSQISPSFPPSGSIQSSTEFDAPLRFFDDWNQEERFLRVVEAVPHGVLMVDRGGRIILINSHLEGIFGWSRSQLLGQFIEVLIPQRYRKSHIVLRENFFKSPAMRLMGIGHEVLALHRDGREIPVENGLSFVELPGGIFGLGCIIDISLRKSIETQMLQTKLDAERKISESTAAESNARQMFLATLSHELRTPLTAVIGSVDLLMQLPHHEECKILLSTIQGCSLTMLHIIGDILDYFKLEAGKMTVEHLAFDPVGLVHEVVMMMSSKVPVQVALQVKSDESVPSRVLGEPHRLRQILLNLVSNALKFTDKGSVTIFLRCNVPTSSTVMNTKNARLVIEVRDTGIGISKEAQTRLFRPFVQADSSTTREFGGTGLGLSISKKLVELLGGEITVESELNVGSSFKFFVEVECFPKDLTVSVANVSGPIILPSQPVDNKISTLTLTSIPSSAISPTTSSVPAMIGVAGTRVIFAEDNPVIQKIIQRMLGNMGCIYSSVLNGRELILAVLPKDNKFDLILTDCQMPDIDGLTATRALRLLGVNIPIVVMSANVSQSDKDNFLQIKDCDYLTKPVTSETLRNCIEKWRNIKSDHP